MNGKKRKASFSAEFIGYVDAPDVLTALKKAIEEFEITDPEKRKRLVAAGEVGAW